MIIGFIYELILFLVAILFCFYLPGNYLSKKLQFKLIFLERLFFCTIFGMMVFVIVSFLMSWIKLQIGIPLIFLVITLLELRDKPWEEVKISGNDLKVIAFIILLSTIFSLTMIVSGVFGNTLRLVGVSGYDGLWHLAVINELKANFPPSHPGFAGVPLKGYHFMYFFIIATVSNIFNFSPISLLYRFFPILVSLMWGLGVFVVMLKWSKDRLTSLIAVFLSMFGGSVVYLSWLEGHKDLSLDSGYGINQPIGSLLNPPFAFSVIIILGFIFALYQFFETKKNQWLIPITVFVGLASIFKVYAGIILIGGFIIFSIYCLYKKKFQVVFSIVGAVIIFFLTYWQFTEKGAHLIFFPWWAPHSVLLSNMPWYRYDEKIYTYTKLGVIKGWIETELYALYIFIIGNLGTRFIGLFLIPLILLKKRQFPSPFAVIVLSLISISFLVPFLFIQTGKVFEITQMFWYFIFLSSLFSAWGLGFILNLNYSKIIKLVIVLVVFFLTVPSTVHLLSYYIPWNQGIISNEDYSVAKFLQKKGSYNQTLLQLPDQKIVEEKDILRWYKGNTPKLIGLGNKRGFLNNEYIEFKDADPKKRVQFIIDIQRADRSEVSKFKVKEQLRNNKIVFIHSPYYLTILSDMGIVKKIYDNKISILYEVIN